MTTRNLHLPTPNSSRTLLQIATFAALNDCQESERPRRATRPADSVIFDEMQNITLDTPLTTDTGMIPAGTVIDSQFFAVNSVSAHTLNSSATFNGIVLGVIYLDGSANWALSNFLGAPGTTYSE